MKPLHFFFHVLSRFRVVSHFSIGTVVMCEVVRCSGPEGACKHESTVYCPQHSYVISIEVFANSAQASRWRCCRYHFGAGQHHAAPMTLTPPSVSFFPKHTRGQQHQHLVFDGHLQYMTMRIFCENACALHHCVMQVLATYSHACLNFSIKLVTNSHKQRKSHPKVAHISPASSV